MIQFFYVRHSSSAGNCAWRSGIRAAAAHCGLVGVKKFQYDIWGDTVNTASRMESSGEVGQVNISEATYALVKSEPGLTFTPRGKVQAKGKGEMEMYFVTNQEPAVNAIIVKEDPGTNICYNAKRYWH
ncbi:MAG: hypothetical protein IPI00_08050 [Flavobacteriales bacterium]|nr:hypothetical protein [Flavobacteriales bacterium]MBK6943909.1 hypothetical protein [Flavobacteriales bacterium]MBK7240117.1 hypothetical protein [Flavobacteriales bacterium]MBP9136870.1 hypothetical protein [Flavobacteriales bacterium]HQV51665.1 adenylate/guanylate cyclase domain-containing protein [Flavobacteriales bacterium]